MSHDVLKDNDVKIELDGKDYYLSWANGAIRIGQTSEVRARRAAAFFVSLWLRGTSASIANQQMKDYLMELEQNEKR